MTTDTATEAAAAAQRAAQKIDLRYCAHSCIDDTGWPDTTEIAAIIAAELAPLLAEAEAADALMPLALKVINLVNDWNADSDNKQFKHPFTKLAKQAELAIIAYRALVTPPEAEGVGK